MILQALYDLYHRLEAEEGNPYGLATPGYSVQSITFRIVLNPDGSLQDIQDARETVTETTRTGRTRTRQVPRQLLVPGKTKSPGPGINPCLFWDNSAYLLGYKKPDKDPAKAEKEAARALETFAATRTLYLEVREEIPALSALRNFYDTHWTPDQAAEWREKLDDFAATGFGVFRILPHLKDVHDLPEVREWWASRSSGDGTTVRAPCLVTGGVEPIARLAEPAIKGVDGTQSGGAKLASYNCTSFESYAKTQTYNSPVSEEATFAYCNTLNALLDGPQSHRHRVRIGDTTAVFWTEKKTATESLFVQLLGGQIEERAEARTVENQLLQMKLEALLDNLRRGGGAALQDLGDDPSSKFYILGLSGNVTRLAVRFWHVSTIAEMVNRLAQHYGHLSLRRRAEANPFHEPEFPSAQRILDQTAPVRNGKTDGKAISPLLGGQLMAAILHGTRYPMTLYQGVLNRLRATDDVSYLKAAILKAVLTRNFQRTIDMSLNADRTEPAYLLGRLFAALERTQEDALGKVNAGLRERFYSSASATPGSAFPRLMRTYQHHLAKMPYGALAERIGPEKAAKAKTGREILIQGIHGPLESYPSHLNLEEQGLFAIGYYHQRQDFYTKKEATSEPAAQV